MTVVEEIEEEVVKVEKYPKLRLLTGGKGPPEDTSGENWLADLERGTTFVARDKNSKEVDYNHYFVLFKSLPKVVLLKWVLPDGKLLDFYVDPVRFSKKFGDYEVLGVDKQEPQKEAVGEEDGSN